MLRKIFHKIITWLDSNQFKPTPKDINNENLKVLAKRLRGKNLKETLTNVLEWQDRNIRYWVERGYLDISIRYFLLLGYIFIFSLILLPTFVLINIFLVRFLLLPQGISLVLSSIIIIALFLGMIFIVNTVFNLICLLILSYPIHKLIRIFLLKNSTSKLISALLGIATIHGIVIGAIVFVLLYLSIIYSKMIRKEEHFIKKIKELIKLVKYTFEKTLSVSDILKYRLAICRDYAKLTAALLLNVYPNEEVYFFGFNFPGHIAAGIKINGKYYILDQKLPVMTLKTWMRIWNKKKIDIYKLKVLNNEKIELEKVNTIKQDINGANPDVNTEKLIDSLMKIMKIKENQCNEEKVISESILLRNFAILYEEDNIVEYSMVRAIKNKIENEFCGNVDKITKIEIQQEGKDLRINIYYLPS